MKITEIKIFPVHEEKLKAFVSVVLDDCFMVNDIKVIHGRDGYFISMPSRRKKNGRFKDVAHPLNNETRQMMESMILAEYDKAVAEDRAGKPAVATLEDDKPTSEVAAPPVPPIQSAPAPQVVADASVYGGGALAASPPASAPAGHVSMGAAGESPADRDPDVDRSLEEVAEAHLRDSFWTT